METGKAINRHRHYTVWFDDKGVRTLAQMKANIGSRSEQVVDARSADRFAGGLPEPRKGVEPGHIPGARNLPHDQLFNADGTWKQGDALKAEFEAAGVDLERGVVTSCGSGITAAVLAFGLATLGKRDVALYDGSWAEWGGDPSTPKERGAAQ